jgi:hypothetical protein
MLDNMSYQNCECDNIERYRRLTKPNGLTYKDICVVTGCGKTSAQKIINDIHIKTVSVPGALTPARGRVTRKSFCEHMDWDFNEIQTFAFAEIAATRIL